MLAVITAYGGWCLLSWALWCAQQQWWLPFVVLFFFGLMCLGLAWRASNYGIMALLGLTTPRLAVRDFRNGIADWLVSARTGWKD